MTIDITATKVLTPALLFAILSPGLLLALPSLSIASGTTNLTSVFIHAAVLTLLYYALAKMVLKVSLTTADLAVPALLFVLLSPGVLLTLPPGAGGVWRSGETSAGATGVHTLVFAIVFATLRSTFPQYY